MNCANHPDRERKAFCQNCGKPLCTECARTVGQAVFCEPCLEARLAAANAAAAGTSQPFGAGPTAGSASYQTVPGGGSAYAYTGTVEGIPYNVRGGTPPPGSPNPGLAFLLGFIPGVGAMYNGQYAKGVVHLIVFAVLVSLSDQNGIFGLFVAFWIFYQAFEAYHTARARRDGTALPNFFGLNDVGERFGFGRSWPVAPGAPPVPGSSGPATASPVPPPPAGNPYPPSSESAAYTAYAAGDAAPGYTHVTPSAGEPSAQPWGAPADTYAPVSPATPLPPTNNFPMGAVVLIGLGILFLVGSTHLFVAFPVRYLLPFLLIGIGVYLFVRRMTATGVSFVDDGSAGYRLRLVRALQSSVWVILVGILFLLDTLNILSWGRSWPLFIIVGGVMAFVQRSAYTAAAAQQVPYPSYAAPPRQPSPAPSDPAPSEPGTSIVPRDREGS